MFVGVFVFVEGAEKSKYYRYLSGNYWVDFVQEISEGGTVHFFNSADEPEPVLLDKGFYRNKNEIVLHDKTSIAIRPFMTFKVLKDSSRREVNRLRTLPIVSSFDHELTKVGQEVFKRIKECVKQHSDDWMKGAASKFLAPIASLCQGSGSGKSKIATEFTKCGPGVYTVQRNANDLGFPLSNNLSAVLKNILSVKENLDPTNEDQSECLVFVSGHLRSKIAAILNYIASILVTYYKELISNTLAKLTAGNQQLSQDAVMKALHDTFAECGPKYADGNTSNYLIPSFDEMLAYYLPEANDPKNTLKVKHISEFIYNLLNSPESILKEYISQTNATPEPVALAICLQLKKLVQDFPFMFIVDEAQLLCEITYGQDNMYNGFSFLRRALTYLKLSTPIFFLALGTKSTIADTNPPNMDSYRPLRALEYPAPIILSGNYDIMRKEKGFNPVDFVPDCENLANPMVFKLLVSLGLPLWASLLFETVIDSAVKKIRNGETGQDEDVLVAWMIRNGLMTNPRKGNMEQLMSRRMADLFNMSDDLKSLSIFYPPQPVLGMAARKICRESQTKSEEKLFTSLQKHLNMLAIDRGEVAEVLALMIVLLAVDNAKNDKTTFNLTKDENLQRIIENCPELENLWETEGFILNRNCSELPQESDPNFSRFYHVTTVENFLLSLYGEEIKPQLKTFPKSTLQGFVNVSHFTKLPGRMVFDPTGNLGKRNPLPNRLTSDSKRIVIDRSLLQYGLTRQLGFIMPPNYFAKDAIIPVCLDKRDSAGRPIYTFISIQIKARQRVSSDQISDMQARLHYVICPNPDHREPTAGCPHCGGSEDACREIFENQIALTISFGEEYEKPPVKFSASSGLSKDEALTRLFGTEKATAMCVDPFTSATKVPDSFLSPLVSHKYPVNFSLQIHSFVWNDTFVEIEDYKSLSYLVAGKEREGLYEAAPESQLTSGEDAANREKQQFKAYKVQNINHRLFCISSLSFYVFKHLFTKPRESIDRANEILDSDLLRFGERSTVNLDNYLAALLTESFVPEYNEQLAQMRGKPHSEDYLNSLRAEAQGHVTARMEIKPNKPSEKLNLSLGRRRRSDLKNPKQKLQKQAKS